MHSFCFLTLLELIHIPHCSLLHLYSNDLNSLKYIHEKYLYIVKKIIIIEKHK